MPTPTRSSSGFLWTVAGVTTLCLASLLGGWWLGRQQGSVPVDSRRSALAQEAQLLHGKVARGEADDPERQRYLELLVGLDRKAEAIAMLEPMADREPERWSLRLMLAELRRDQGDPAGAERELRQILNRSPAQVDALQLLTLIRLDQGQAALAESQVKAIYGGLLRPEVRHEAMGVGLLLAELQQKRGETAAAEATYQELSQAFPQDRRPLIALALLRHGRGNGAGALEALQAARSRNAQGPSDPRLDALAASWGLERLRAAPSPAPARPGSAEPARAAAPPASGPAGPAASPQDSPTAPPGP